jgi:hypothetical protein
LSRPPIEAMLAKPLEGGKMKKQFLAGMLAFGALASFTAASADAETRSILLTQKDLDAAQALLHVEDSYLLIDKLHGTFIPPNGVKYLGIPRADFDIQVGKLLKIVDLKFHDIRSKTAEIKLVPDAIEFRAVAEDEGRELTSRLGWVDGKDIVGIARLRFAGLKDGVQALSVIDVRIEGKFKGGGLLKSEEVIRRAHKFAEETIRDEVGKALDNDEFREKILQGLLIWAGFSTGEEWKSVVPGSIRIESGLLVYSVTR